MGSTHRPIRHPSRARRGFTIIELLISTVVIVILVGLLLPSLHWVRESTRSLTCRNNLRILAAACQRHDAAHSHLPVTGSYGGQSGEFTGDPDLGFNQSQRGSWLYSILPYLGKLEIWELGAGDSSAYPVAHGRRIEVAIDTFNCPSRTQPFLTNSRGFRNSGPHNRRPRADFASARSEFGTAALDQPGWQTLGRRTTEITDGVGNVFLAGERYLAPSNYNGGIPASNWETLGWNDGGWTAGSDWDTSSRVTLSPLRDTAAPPPVTGNVEWYFGGPHASLHMAMCDGSVRGVSYMISPSLFRQLGIINDGLGTVQDVIE
jgi:prepilin-type N-terminal cleavage/methylation domain-containing protein